MDRSGCLTVTTFVGLQGAVRVEGRGCQMQFIIPGMGQQIHRFGLECVECTGEVTALHFDVPFAAETASYGADSEIGLEGHGRRELLRRGLTLRVSPIVTVSVQIPPARATGVRRCTLHRQRWLVPGFRFRAIDENVERTVGIKRVDIGIALVREMDPPTGER